MGHAGPHHGASGSRKPLGQLLKEMELVTESQIQEALQIQKEQGGALGRILVDLGFVSEDEMLFALGAQAGMDVVNLDEANISTEVTEKVPAQVANIYRVVPVSFEDGILTVAMADPLNVSVLDDLRFMLDKSVREVKGAVSNEDQIARAIEKFYKNDAESVDSILAGMSDDDMKVFAEAAESDKLDLENLEGLAQAAPVVKLLNLILMQAIKDQASDIHFEPFEDDFKIRYRVDGVLYEMMPPPPHLALALISRIKVMSNLDIAETRLPQDGRIELAIGGRPVDLRVSTLPTMFGESCVMRILDRSVVNLDLQAVGLRDRDLELTKHLIGKPNGIVLVTGPTGSGKTTTLYSCLNHINSIDVKIITTEDPVEYDIDGIVQCQVNAEIGVTYADCLRSILRQDPDTILVGEIRDKETAQMAIEASLTGHLVFSTLHTNDAPSVVARLVDIGIEPFLVSATLEGIIAQRLVRRICTGCREEYVPTRAELIGLGLNADDYEGKTFAYGKGCPKCNNSGHRGRTAIYEIMTINDQIRNLVLQQAATEKLREAARENGMRTLRESGVLSIFDHITTVEEIIRETLQTA